MNKRYRRMKDETLRRAGWMIDKKKKTRKNGRIRDGENERWRDGRKTEMEGIRKGRLVSMLEADHCGEKKLIHVTAPIPDEPLVLI